MSAIVKNPIIVKALSENELDVLVNNYKNISILNNKFKAFCQDHPDIKYFSELQQLNIEIFELHKNILNLRQVLISDHIDIHYIKSNMPNVILDIEYSNIVIDYLQTKPLQKLINAVLVSFSVEKDDISNVKINFSRTDLQIILDITVIGENLVDKNEIHEQVLGELNILNAELELVESQPKLLNLVIRFSQEAMLQKLLLLKLADQTLAVNEKDIIEIIKIDNSGLVAFQGEYIPVIDLRKILSLDSANSSLAMIGLIENRKIAFVIDELEKMQEFIIRPIGNFIKSLGPYNGYCVSHNSVPILCLDLKKITENNLSPQANNIENIDNLVSKLEDAHKNFKLNNLTETTKQHIVLVDESPLFRRLLAQSLKEASYIVYSFDDIFMAKDFIENNNVELVITDINIIENNLDNFVSVCNKRSIPLIGIYSPSDNSSSQIKDKENLFIGLESKMDHQEILKSVRKSINHIQEAYYDEL